MKRYIHSIAPNPTRVRLYLAEKRAAVGGIIHATRSPLGWPPNPGLAEYLRAVLVC